MTDILKIRQLTLHISKVHWFLGWSSHSTGLMDQNTDLTILPGSVCQSSFQTTVEGTESWISTLISPLVLHWCPVSPALKLNIIWILNGSPQPLLLTYQGEIEAEEEGEGRRGEGGLKFKISSSRSSLQFISPIPQLPSCQWYLDAIFQNKRNYCPKLKLFLESFHVLE